jgi:hypothetical protein
MTVYVNDGWLVKKFVNGTPDTMARYVRLYNDDVDEMMSVLVPSARYRKAHYAYGRFAVAQPHARPPDGGLHSAFFSKTVQARRLTPHSSHTSSRRQLL